jgi:hypothetical protein
MSDSGRRDLLSIGVFLIIIIVSILLYTPLQIITDWVLILPLIIVLSGCWFMVLAGIRGGIPQKYERGALSTFSWGLLLAALGGAWLIVGYGFSWIYALIVILLVLAVVAITVALKKK